ncbi:hypothetical protein BBROOKSOX_140 [Bathymodiolus brooksi thiotrophic gill symbiont]|nr:hypothetical protein BBROOKSOX_140 [Bathymodiolus brooksi thiotrophic gill symbiont]
MSTFAHTENAKGMFLLFRINLYCPSKIPSEMRLKKPQIL